jgi:hypothetical protein
VSRRWLVRSALLVVAAIVTLVVVRLVGKVDWAEVRSSLAHLDWWQAPILFVVLVLRQVLGLTDPSLTGLLVVGAAGVAAYAATVWVLDREHLREAGALLRRTS